MSLPDGTNRDEMGQERGEMGRKRDESGIKCQKRDSMGQAVHPPYLYFTNTLKSVNPRFLPGFHIVLHILWIYRVPPVTVKNGKETRQMTSLVPFHTEPKGEGTGGWGGRGEQTVDSGRWTVDGGQWTVDGGRLAGQGAALLTTDKSGSGELSLAPCLRVLILYRGTIAL